MDLVIILGLLVVLFTGGGLYVSSPGYQRRVGAVLYALAALTVVVIALRLFGVF